MQKINHRIRDEQGLHARVAGVLVKEAAQHSCAIHLGTREKMVDAKKILGVMCLSLKSGQQMIMSFDGEDEEESAVFFSRFLTENI